MLCLRGLFYDFLSIIFCLAVPKNFVGELFCALFLRCFGNKKVCRLKVGGGGSIKIFRRFLLSHSAKNSLKNPSVFSRKVRASKNFMLKGEISRFFLECLLTHSTDKFGRGTLLCLKEILVSNLFTDRGLGEECITIYHQNCFV